MFLKNDGLEFSVPLTLLNSIYFTVITAGTIGYGDIYPKSPLARFLVVVLIFWLLYLFASNANEILSYIQNYDKFRRKYKFKNHTIIFSCANLDITHDLLKFYYQKYPNKKILIVGDRTNFLILS